MDYVMENFIVSRSRRMQNELRQDSGICGTGSMYTFSLSMAEDCAQILHMHKKQVAYDKINFFIGTHLAF